MSAAITGSTGYSPSPFTAEPTQPPADRPTGRPPPPLGVHGTPPCIRHHVGPISARPDPLSLRPIISLSCSCSLSLFERCMGKHKLPKGEGAAVLCLRPDNAADALFSPILATVIMTRACTESAQIDLARANSGRQQERSSGLPAPGGR